MMGLLVSLLCMIICGGMYVWGSVSLVVLIIGLESRFFGYSLIRSFSLIRLLVDGVKKNCLFAISICFIANFLIFIIQLCYFNFNNYFIDY